MLSGLTAQAGGWRKLAGGDPDAHSEDTDGGPPGAVTPIMAISWCFSWLCRWRAVLGRRQTLTREQGYGRVFRAGRSLRQEQRPGAPQPTVIPTSGERHRPEVKSAVQTGVWGKLPQYRPRRDSGGGAERAGGSGREGSKAAGANCLTFCSSGKAA